jgi:hypothetical protein
MAEIDKAQLTPASAWRKDYLEGVQFTMPHNGRVIALRALDEQYLLATGKIPDTFSQLALLAVKAGDNADDEFEKQIKNMPELEYAQINESYNRAKITAGLAHPKVVDKATGDDEIEYEWLGKKDKEFILAKLNEPAEEWLRFPAKPDTGLELVPVIQVIEEDTEQIAEYVEADSA